MPESFNSYENFNAQGTAQEVTKEQQEQYRKNHNKKQQAAKKIKEAEKKRKKDDNALSIIISRFIKSNSHSDITSFIVTLLSKNMPPDIIISIISIFYSPAWSYVNKHLINKKIDSNTLIANFPKELVIENNNKKIHNWLNIITIVSKRERVRLIKSVYNIKNKDIDMSLVNISALSLLKILKNEESEIYNLEEYFRNFWINILEKHISSIKNKKNKNA